MLPWGRRGYGARSLQRGERIHGRPVDRGAGQAVRCSWRGGRFAASPAALRGHPFIRWSFIPRKADRLLIAPQDLRTADGTRASEIYAGRFAFAGKVVI